MASNAITLAMFIVMVNLCLSWAVQADIFGAGNVHYESEVINYVEGVSNSTNTPDSLLSNLPIVNAIPQAQTMFSMLGGLVKCLTFDWVKDILPAQLREDTLTLSIIDGFNALFMLFIMYTVVVLLSSAIGRVV